MSRKDVLKAGLRRVPGLRAVTGRTEQLVDAQQDRLAHVDLAIRDLTAAVVDLQQRAGHLDAHVPDLLNTVASHHGAQRALKHDIDTAQADLQRQVDSLWAALSTPGTGVDAKIGELFERVETVRREVLFELRYGARPGERPATPGLTGAPEARIVDRERFDAAVAEGLRLNIGCGHLPVEGYVNVDMRELPGVDVVAGVDDLPVEPGSVAEIFSSHVLEHFPEQQLVRQLLPYWSSLLRPGGELRAIVPDGGAMVRHHVDGDMPWAELREVLYGGQEYEGDFHFTMFTTESLAQLLADAGFVDVEVEDRDRRNGLCWEFQIVGRRPG
jgi:predicted SAM-dependent methyltransferase